MVPDGTMHSGRLIATTLTHGLDYCVSGVQYKGDSW